MDISQFMSSLGGGGLVAVLSWFVFSRIIETLDKMSDRLSNVEKQIVHVDRIDALEDTVIEHGEKIAIVETKLHASSRY